MGEHSPWYCKFFQLAILKLFTGDHTIGGNPVVSKDTGSALNDVPNQKTDRFLQRGAGARLLYRFCQFNLQILAILLLDYRVFGALGIPRRGAVVVASNHQSYLDPLLVGLCLPRRAFYLARESLFRFFGFRRIIHYLNALPIPRGTFCRQGIHLARGVIRKGEVLIMFPEGTRSPDGKLGTVKRGVELITGSQEAAVIPAYIDGSFRVWPRSGGFHFHPIRIFFGTPLEGGAPGADKGCIENEAAGAAGPGGENGLSADLPTRLEAAYRNLEAKARRVRWVGAAGASRRLGYFG